MSGRIRGHYRIDDRGRVEMLSDVNGSALEFAARPLTIAARRNVTLSQSRITHFCVVGLIIASLGALSTGALPYIERKVANAQIAKVIATRAEIRRTHALRVAHHVAE